MQKQTLFLDFDGLKFDTLQAHTDYFNYTYGISSVPEDYINNPSIETVLNRYLPPEKWVNRERAYLDLSENFLSSIKWHENIPMLDGAAEVIPLLAEKYVLWTVTARQKLGIDVIRAMCEKHIPNCITDIHCVWEHIGNGKYKGIPKREFIKNFPASKAGFIDDTPKEIIELQDILPCYLFDPKRLCDHYPDIENRVYSWKEIGEIFL